MSEAQQAIARNPQLATRFRDWFADHLGVGQDQKRSLYEDLSRSSTLLDATYWLQILFAAGIATLGLVLNSPAVIIGAMLISPLMGPILSGGLSLASGDVILGVRALLNLGLSCAVAITFAVLLVVLLPFKEMTNEIAVRTQPTTLDLVVAFFSGAIGSIATCKQVKGVVTSIPGVAIAVALMPPLCVVGYGVGFAFSVSGSEGMRIARGGGLLFLTNLVAITFTAMLVFLALHIDTTWVKERIEEWRNEDKESAWLKLWLSRLRVSEKIRRAGSLPGRLLLIGLPILVILIPLAQSFSQLKVEIAKQQQENRIRQDATGIWQQSFAKLPDGQQRSFIDQLSVLQQDGKYTLQLRVFTSKPFTSSERTDFAHMTAAKLGLPPDAVAVQLVEIPTTSGELVAKAQEERRVEAPPTIAQLQASFLQGVEAAVRGIRLPPPARLVDFEAATGSAEPIQVDISYLSDRDIQPDANALIVDDVRSRLIFPTAKVKIDRIRDSYGPVVFGRNQALFTPAVETVLSLAGLTLQQHPLLRVEIAGGANNRERSEMADERAAAINDYLVSTWQIEPARISISPSTGSARETTLTLKLPDQAQ
jgi:uncharacterized hydrophobic protein (TIGR00271 family)